jgi:hypothetical protein
MPGGFEFDPVQFLSPSAEELPDYAGSGYTTPGWYFWDETWASCHGPYPTTDAARSALTEYCAELDRPR